MLSQVWELEVGPGGGTVQYNMILVLMSSSGFSCLSRHRSGRAILPIEE